MSNPTTTWPLIPAAETPPVTSPPTGPAAIPFARFAHAPFGVGLLRPFQRDKKGDFAFGQDGALVASAVGQILGTLCSSEHTGGELPWRPEFGSLLHVLRHRPNTPALDELARTYVVDALQRWERRAVVKRVEVSRDSLEEGGSNSLIIKVRFDFVDITTGSIIFADLTTTVNF